jgi:hypothetical protein
LVRFSSTNPGCFTTSQVGAGEYFSSFKSCFQK